MKGFKLTLILMPAFAIVVGFSGMAAAFHGGGVAYCEGCHSMHNSADNPVTGTPSSLLLKGSDSSSTCLNCHNGTPGSYHISTTTGNTLSQGGDFFWVKTNFSYPGRGGAATSYGYKRGHNIVAADFGYVADTANATAPGGTYSANLLGCTSCHDAHGQVQDGTKGGSAPVSVSGSYGAADPTDGSIHGNYRLLGDSKYEAGDNDADGYEFDNDAPVAFARNISGSAYGAQVDYGSGMSEWCANCHNYAGQAAKHVSGAAALLGGYATNYNSYIATGNWSAGGGNAANAYDSLVPFERGVTDGSLLDPQSKQGPESSDNVMCLTCHRAHASANDNIGRWDFTVDEMANSKALIATDLPTTAIPYYADGTALDIVAKYGEYQRNLCNKCHAQD